MSQLGKICTICGADCAGQPRTKDAKGRYFHEACYEKALRARDARDADPAGAAMASPAEAPGAEDHGLLHELIEQQLADEPTAGQPCPSCGAAVVTGATLCTNCGHSMLGGGQIATTVARSPAPSRSGASLFSWKFFPWHGSAADGKLGAVLLHPATVAGAYLVVNAVIILGAFAFPPFFELFMGLQVVYEIISLIVTVWILIAAFGDGFATGLLTLCIPLYIVYFVFWRCDSLWIRYLFTVHLLVYLGSVIAQFALFAATSA